MSTKHFNSAAEAHADASARRTSVWEHENFGRWAQEFGKSRFVTGSHDGLHDDLGWGTAGSYVHVKLYA